MIFSVFFNNDGQHQQCCLVRFNVSMNGTLHGGYYTIEIGCIAILGEMDATSFYVIA